MATLKYLRAYIYWVLLRCRADLCRVRNMMSVIDFSDLQALSGYRQVSKVIDWLRENQIRFVVGGDGKPRTVADFLEEDLDGQKERKPSAVRFK